MNKTSLRYYYILEGPWEDQTFVYDSLTHRIVGTYISNDRNEVLKCRDEASNPNYQTWAISHGKEIEINPDIFNALYESYFFWKSDAYKKMGEDEKQKFGERTSELMTRFSIPLWLRHAKDDGKMLEAVSELEEKLAELIKEGKVELTNL